jgi:hypothetical protein
MKDQITTDLQKAKEVGGARVEKIRQIFRDAFSQSLAELKEGGSELGSIAKTSTSTLIENLQNQPKAAPQEAPIPVEVKIESDEESAESTDAVVTEVLAAELIDAESVTAHISDPVVTDPESEAQNSETEAASQSVFKTAFARAVALLKEKGIDTKLNQQRVEFKQQLDQLDAKLGEQFGERYTVIKQDFHKDMQTAKGWYDRTRANAANGGTFWVDQKQTELEVKAGEAGATVAQKEEKIKHLLKELWQTVTR